MAPSPAIRKLLYSLIPRTRPTFPWVRFSHARMSPFRLTRQRLLLQVQLKLRFTMQHISSHAQNLGNECSDHAAALGANQNIHTRLTHFSFDSTTLFAVCGNLDEALHVILMHSVSRALERHIYTCMAQDSRTEQRVCAPCIKRSSLHLTSPAEPHLTSTFHTPSLFSSSSSTPSETTTTCANPPSSTEWRFGGAPHLHIL